MWIVATLLGILLSFVLLLLIPINLSFHVEKEEAFQSRVRVKWLFSLIGKNIRSSEKKSQPKKEKGRRNLRALLETWKARDFLPKLSGFIRDVFRLVHVRKLKVYMRFGLDDPADTGIFFAIAGPAMVLLNRLPSLDIQIEPDFEYESFRGHLQGDLRIIPIKLVRPVVFLVFSITTMRVIKIMIRARRK